MRIRKWCVESRYERMSAEPRGEAVSSADPSARDGELGRIAGAVVRHPERMRHAGDEVERPTAVMRIAQHVAPDDVRIRMAVRGVRAVLATVVAQQCRAPPAFTVGRASG